MKNYSLLFLFLFMMTMVIPSLGQTTKIPDTIKPYLASRTLPFGASWAASRGLDLPRPFGISGFFTYMSRDIVVTDVSVEFGNLEPQSIGDYATFAVRNQTAVTALRFDTWIFPVMNVYVLAGYAQTNANMNVELSIDRPLLPPTNMAIQTTVMVKGPYLGAGSTLVGGYRNWFMMADANYGQTWPDALNNSINFTMLSVRSGISAKMGTKNTLRAWLGALYMYSRCDIEIVEQSNVLGEVLVRVQQQPKTPWTAHSGMMLSIGKNLEFMAELGSNLDDASISVLTASFRF